MINEELSLQQKLQFVLNNKNLIPPLYQNALSTLQTSQVQEITNSIKVQTLYRIMQPALLYTNIELAKNQVLYPVSGVLAFPHPQLEYHHVNMKMVMWIESGGTRCIPLKSNAKIEEMNKIMSQTHSMIVPDCFFSSEENKNLMKNIIEGAQKESHYPLLFLGSSAILALQVLSQTTLTSEFKQEKVFSQVFFTYDSNLPKDLELPLRISIENRKKIALPIHKVPLKQFKAIQNFIPSGVIPHKDELFCLTGELKDKPVFFIFNQAWFFDNPDSISVGHKLIGNFIQLSKEQKRVVSEKNIEKRLLAAHKLVHKNDQMKSHYKITF